MNITSGLVSAYQMLNYSDQKSLQNNVAGTSAEMPSFEIISFPDNFLKELETEYIKIKIPYGYDQLASALLSRKVPFSIFPDNIFGLNRGSLKILEESGIPFEIIE